METRLIFVVLLCSFSAASTLSQETTDNSLDPSTCMSNSLLQSHVDHSRILDTNQSEQNLSMLETKVFLEHASDQPILAPLTQFRVHTMLAMSLISASSRLSDQDVPTSAFYFIVSGICVFLVVVIVLVVAVMQDDAKRRPESHFNPVLTANRGKASLVPSSKVITAPRPSVTHGASMMPVSSKTVPGSSRMVPPPRMAEKAKTDSALFDMSSFYPGSLAASSPEVPRQVFADVLHLCPELVVPDMTECTLLIPQLTDITSDTVKASIDDNGGVSVFRFEYTSIEVGDSARLSLRSPKEEQTFATLRETSNRLDNLGGRSFALGIHGAEKAHQFGVIRANLADSSYEVTSLAGEKIRFRGETSGTLSAVDEQGQLLALGQPAGEGPGGLKRRSVRIGPLVDAGLIAVSFLGIDILQLELQKTPNFGSSKFMRPIDGC